MAKHYSKRASRKRAYKKRRTIRKLKTTLRRKIQRGGGTQEEKLIKLIMNLLPVVLPVVLANLNVFIKILSIILGSGVIRGGSKFSREQRGGGGLSAVAKQQLLTELGKLKKSFKHDSAVSNCIERFITKYNAEPVVDIPSDVVIEPITINPALLLESELNSEIQQTSAVAETIIQPNETTIDKIKRILTKGINGIKSKIDSQFEGLFQKIKESGMNPEDIACLETLKAKVLADMSAVKVSNSIENLKTNPLFSNALDTYDAWNSHLSSSAIKMNDMAKKGVSNGLDQLGNAAGNLAINAFNRVVIKKG